MTDTNELPEPELGYIQTDKSNQPAFSARQMREAMKHARAQVQGNPSWWMRETAEGAEWTDTAPLVLSGWTPLYTAPQPAQATQAEVTDSEIVAVMRDGNNCNYNDEAEHIQFARAILALRPERAPMTPREIELIDGMIAVQLDHAQRCDAISNRAMAEKQKGWDMERVELLRRIRSFGITAQAKKETP